MKKSHLITSALVMFLASTTVSAAFIGNAIKAHVFVPPSFFFGPGGTFSEEIFIAADGIDVPLFGVLNESIIDVSDNNILIDFWRTDLTYFDLGQYIFSDIASSLPEITNVTINSSATTGFYTAAEQPLAFEQSRISFDENQITIDLAGLGAKQSSQLSLNVEFATVPEPEVPLLLVSGIALMRLVRGKWKRMSFVKA